MGRQWKRLLELQIGNTTVVSSGEDVSAGLQVQFKITQKTVQAPNVAHIVVSNLSDKTANGLKEQDAVSLSAGYVDNSGLLFKGTVTQIIRGRESPTDTILQVFAGDGVEAYNHAIVNKSLAKGSTQLDHVNTFLDALKPFGITKGYLPTDLLTKFKYPRGVAFSGMVKEYLRTVALSTGTTWSIQNGALQMVPTNGSVPGNAFTMNSTTGMIGMPTQTVDGIMVRCLINPSIKIDTQIQIDQKDIQQAALSQNYDGAAANALIPTLATDGFYTVKFIETTGATRGVPWYMDLSCLNSAGTGFQPLKLGFSGSA